MSKKHQQQQQQKPLMYFVGANPSVTFVQQQIQPIQQITNNYFNINSFLLPEILQRPQIDSKISKENSLVTASSRKCSNSPLPLLKKPIQSDMPKSQTEKFLISKKPPIIRKKSPKSERPRLPNSPKQFKEKSNSQENLKCNIAVRTQFDKPSEPSEHEQLQFKQKLILRKHSSQYKKGGEIPQQCQQILPMKIIEVKEETYDQIEPVKVDNSEEKEERESEHDSKWYEKKMNYFDQQRVKLKEIIKRQASSVENKKKSDKPLPVKVKAKKELEDYQLGSILGQGSYAIVKLGIHKITNDKVAIKMYDKGRLFDPQRQKNIKKEIEILRKSNKSHRNRKASNSKIYEYKTFKINLVMSFGGNISLKQLLKQRKERKLPISEARNIFCSIIKAVRYLHGNNIIHRDIKLENILLDNNEVRLIDLGFATHLPENVFLSQSCGTPPYMSPELLPPHPQYREGADIWSCGVVLFLMVKGTFPFKANSEKDLFLRIKKQELTNDTELPSDLWDVIKGCLEKDASKRKTALEIGKSLWVTGYE